MDERRSVMECASPLALSTRESRAGPSVVFFRFTFPPRAAEDCRTPGPFGVHRFGRFPPVPGIRLVPSAATGMSAAASWSARVLSRSRLAHPVAGPNAPFFRIPFPARAAEDCRTPGRFGVHQLGGFPPVRGIRLVPSVATGMSAAASWSARVLSRSRLAKLVRDQSTRLFTSRFQPERQRTAALRDRSESIAWEAFHPSRGSASFPRRLRDC